MCLSKQTIRQNTRIDMEQRSVEPYQEIVVVAYVYYLFHEYTNTVM